jgi:hypothetical protein
VSKKPKGESMKKEEQIFNDLVRALQEFIPNGGDASVPTMPGEMQGSDVKLVDGRIFKDCMLSYRYGGVVLEIVASDADMGLHPVVRKFIPHHQISSITEVDFSMLQKVNSGQLQMSEKELSDALA